MLVSKYLTNVLTGFPRWLSGKDLPAKAGDAGDMGSIPGLGRPPRGGNGNPLQYSCLENPVDREAWRATAHGVKRIGHNLATKPPPLLLNLNHTPYHFL